MLVSISIRYAQSSERETLEALQRPASLENPRNREVLGEHADAIQIPAHQLASGKVYVAECNDEIAGIAATPPCPDGDTALHALFVDPVMWRRGIGNRLLEYCEDVAYSSDSTALCVIGNPHAGEFCIAAGFKHVRVVARRSGEGHLYRKQLRRTFPSRTSLEGSWWSRPAPGTYESWVTISRNWTAVPLSKV